MKIALLGDSFGDVNAWQFDSILKPLHEQSWPYRLSQKYNVHNFAESGSGLFFSATKLEYLETDDFDKIIFLASDATRFEVNEQHHFRVSNRHIVPSGLHVVKDKEIKKTLYNYIKYFQNPKQYRYITKAIMNEIKNTYKDKVLIIQNFNMVKYYENAPFANGVSLSAIDETEDRILNIEKNQTWRWCKVNHLTTMTHNKIYKEIENWLHDGTFNLNVDYLKYLRKNLAHNIIDYQIYKDYFKEIKKKGWQKIKKVYN